LGPVLTGLVEVEGVTLKALLDTGSPCSHYNSTGSSPTNIGRTMESIPDNSGMESSSGSFETYLCCVAELQWRQTPGGATDSSNNESFRLFSNNSDSGIYRGGYQPSCLLVQICCPNRDTFLFSLLSQGMTVIC